MKDKFRNEYFRRAVLILMRKLNGRNKIMALNAWDVSIMRYGAGIFKGCARYIFASLFLFFKGYLRYKTIFLP